MTPTTWQGHFIDFWVIFGADVCAGLVAIWVFEHIKEKNERETAMMASAIIKTFDSIQEMVRHGKDLLSNHSSLQPRNITPGELKRMKPQFPLRFWELEFAGGRLLHGEWMKVETQFSNLCYSLSVLAHKNAQTPESLDSDFGRLDEAARTAMGRLYELRSLSRRKRTRIKSLEFPSENRASKNA